ncbi:oxidative damage protection protein [Salinisphaera japonica]|uniref:Probable Fe(2+)-trafficking protein n=1 Tax=Salinisphaera japonica YTM-1 TaxID=1209778 RepID=A0A423PWP4_9GAMM|nr:oxidative damage protection protein [Salinisphaera japonica]MBH03661.1 oxidative damage protection protein [Xanthomonadales bacterium]ROO30033.1 iron transporter [Salinisphaera japonica YTM-1]|tara:strand:- start:1668 stop:1940 length:273 start_codon:yes stop_codon:yes gene_type:complete
MSHTVQCVKLGYEAEGLPRQPLPGDLGKRIYDNVSMMAWQQWMQEQTRLINEYGLHLADPKAREFLAEQTEEYFFGSGQTAETHFVPPKS